MAQARILKDCWYLPNGQPKRKTNMVRVRPDQIITVSDVQAEKMVAGNVAQLVEEKKPRAKKIRGKKQDSAMT